MRRITLLLLFIILNQAVFSLFGSDRDIALAYLQAIDRLWGR